MVRVFPLFRWAEFNDGWRVDSSQRIYPAAWLVLAFALLACLLPCGTGVCAEPAKGPNAPPEFQLDKGFRLELVAAEPLVTAPVALAFDENGRLFVAEMSGNTQPQAGRIRLLQDTNGDGAFETSMVYADNLPPPSALACYDGGLFVAAGPDLLYLKNTRTNGAADSRRAFFHWLPGTNAPNAEALPNNFKWGLDNRVHGAAGGLLEAPPATNTPGANPVPLGWNGLSFDPRAPTVAVTSGPARTGLSFDHRGREFVCERSRPLQMPVYEQRYMARNPFFAAPPEMFDVASPATAIFPLTEGQRFSTAAAAPGATNAAATRSAPARLPARAWLTNACSCLVYRGNAFPPAYLGNAFVCDPKAHVIHRMVLRQSGLVMVAASPAAGASPEFLASKDPSVRPMQIIDGPDGALYVADHQDDEGRGRIYRIVPANFKPPKPPRLGKATTYDLVAMLSHPNGWYRDTAARLLYARQDPAAVPLLAKTLADAPAPLARLHALHALNGLGALNQAHLAGALRDTDDRVREHAVLLTEKLVGGGALTGPLGNQVPAMAADASPHVRYQLAFTLGEIRQPERAQALAGMIRRDPGDPLMQAAVLSSAADGAGSLFVILAGDAQFRANPAGLAFLQRLATMIGVKGRSEEAAQVLDFIDRTPLDPQRGFAFLDALGEGLHRANSSLAQMDGQGRMGRFYSQAFDLAINTTLLGPMATNALRLLGISAFTFATIGDQLLLLLVSGQPEAVQVETIATLGRFNDPRIAPALIRRWSALSPRLRNEAITALLARGDRIADVLTAAEKGQIGASDFPSTQMNFLRTHRDPAISQRALRLFGPVPVERPEAMRQFTPALRLQGTADRGRAIFQARCAACHQLGGQGQALGPDLAGARVYGKEHALAAILQPNRKVRPNDSPYVVETGGGETLIGLLRDANSTTLTLRQPGGVAMVLPRANVPYLLAQPWSLMPTGLEAGLAPQDMADLLEYIMTPPR
jgi:putative membrane-bound dehydrogenase-like protein